MTVRKFDIVIFGATGFTGKIVIEDLAVSISKGLTYGITWAVSARSHERTIKVLEEIQSRTGINLSNIPFIQTNVYDDASIKNMTKQTRVVVNCVGPYTSLGEPVVRACLETHTHHLDLSAEPQYVEGMQVKYGQKAEDAGVFIVGSCGWCAVVSDLAVQLMDDKFPGELVWVEEFITISRFPSGFNHATWDSFIEILATRKELKNIRTTLYETIFEKKIPESIHRLKKKLWNYLPGSRSIYIPFADMNRDVVMRTQTHNYIVNNKRPIELQTYINVGSWFSLIRFSMCTLMLAPFLFVLPRFSFGRKLLTNYPRLFTFGQIKKEGPSRESVDKTSFEQVLVGRGWREPLDDPTDEPMNPPTEASLSFRIKGPDPGYITASTCINQSAVTLLQERDKIRFKGGVLTPGLLYRDTSLLKRIEKHGISMQLIQENHK